MSEPRSPLSPAVPFDAAGPHPNPLPAVPGEGTGAINRPVERIEISAEPLDVAAAIAFVSHPSAGGIDVFLGTTRAERRADGADLVALDYEAYADLARKQFADLVATARQRWPIVRCVLLHRTGRVNLAEPSVVIAVSTPHRGESFEACRWLIDSLKQVAAVWKQEVWTDGDRTWVAGTETGVRRQETGENPVSS